MRILNFGSLNIDKVYTVPIIVRGGETISSSGLQYFAGGKGLNQSVALARAGASVYHAGRIGSDEKNSKLLLDLLNDSGVDTTLIETDSEVDTGHAVIQVDSNGQNSIILHGGANLTITQSYADKALGAFKAGDYLLLQNEISCLDYIINQAHEKGMRIALNPAPMNDIITSIDLSKIDLLILNETEGSSLTGKTEPDEICSDLLECFPALKIILTLGSRGARYAAGETRLKQAALDVPVVDTTAAGDTFIGYFLASVTQGKPVNYALKAACAAAGLAVGRRGAAVSIPNKNEIRSCEHNFQIEEDFS
jgi:ribokinase